MESGHFRSEVSDDESSDEQEVTQKDLNDQKYLDFQKLQNEVAPVERLVGLLSLTAGQPASQDDALRRRAAERLRAKKKSKKKSLGSQNKTAPSESNPKRELSNETETAVVPFHVRLSKERVDALAGRRVPRSQNVGLYSSYRTKWLPVIAFLDTGTSGNWMSQRIVDRGAFRPQSGKTVQYTAFNGINFTSDEVVETTWHGEGSDKTHEAVFRVAGESAPFDVLFGRNMLDSEASECLTADKIIDPALVLVQLKKCNAESLTVEQNRAANEAVAAELEKQQDHKIMQNKTRGEAASVADEDQDEPRASTDHTPEN